MKPPVTTKHDFVQRYLVMEFGNMPPTWPSYRSWFNHYLIPKLIPPSAVGWPVITHAFADWFKEKERMYAARFHVRNRVTGGKTWYNIRPADLHKTWNAAALLYGEHDLYISQMVPGELTLIQGEAMRMPGGLYLHYSLVPKPMRDALAEMPRDAFGIMASCLIQQYMDPLSYEWFQYLLDEYPDHVIEFSTYSIDCGMIPGRNTIFWEVRQY